jgi:hypothetical protein
MAAILGAKEEDSPSRPVRRAGGDELTERVAKLRELRESLNRYQEIDRAVSLVPASGVRRWLYRRLGVEGARFLDADPSLGAAPAKPAASRGPRPLPVTGALAVILAIGGGLWAVSYRTRLMEPAVAAAVAAPALPQHPPAEILPALPEAVQPESIWLVESGEDWEQYSNGLRIETAFKVKGDARRYRVFNKTSGEMGPVETAPIGILFHTTESDIWPLEETNNDRLRTSSQRLLKYVQRNRSYHYLIDRFGRVFRVVEEDGRANHAGYSVWARDNSVYLNLNSQFLGISWETRWEGGQALPITKAQLSVGRDLTDFLRKRYSIPADMCVTHGLTSVNPKKHLIGHHVDWARGFPFDAFGLPDQYQKSAPSVDLFGFGYDEELLKVLPEPWSGVKNAERTLEKEAKERGWPLEAVRREKQQMFDQWIALQVKDDQQAREGAKGNERT